MVARPETDEITGHGRQDDGQHKENAKGLDCLPERVRNLLGCDAQSRRPPSQARCHKQRDDARQEYELRRIRRDNGPEELDKALQQ